MTRVTAFAPGSVGNVGPGLDVLGLAVAGAGDWVTVERLGVRGLEVRDPGHEALPTDPARHASALAAQAVLTRAGMDVGLALSVLKGLPISGGQGGSAASAVAAGFATNVLLGRPLGPIDVLAACLEAEAAVAGRHADNLAPSLLGSAVLVRTVDPLDVVVLPVPPSLRVVLAHPAQQLRTADSRAVLPDAVTREVAIHQSAQVAAMVAALYSGDLELLGRAIDDRIAEPARSHLLPGFVEAKRAALAAGALGASISGSGPTAFALADGEGAAERVAQAMRGAYHAAGVTCTVRVASVDTRGARVVREPGAFE
ncbi:MAG TPA: homoserine kinase [Gemmatimonadales bacterium]|nr:homoserine kinase [Gemmatimonadales bacterium]